MIKHKFLTNEEIARLLNTEQVEVSPVDYNNITMSKEDRGKMSLNEYDQRYYFEVIKMIGDNIKGEQANCVAAQNVLIHTKLEMIVDGVSIFQKNREAIEKVGDYNDRLTDVEKDLIIVKKRVHPLALISIIFGTAAVIIFTLVELGLIRLS